MRKIITVIMVLLLLTLLFRALHVRADTKSDESCTGQETVGRCADKCPDQTDILQGYDKETGAAICKPACPQSDEVDEGDCEPPDEPLDTVDTISPAPDTLSATSVVSDAMFGK